MTDMHKAAFREEAHELFSELEASLLELEETPADADLVGRVFRAMHTIKGSGAMFGFENVAAFTHDVETLYDLVRNGKAVITKDVIDLTLSACDEIRKMVNGENTGPDGTGRTKAITEAFRRVIAGVATGETRRIDTAPARGPDQDEHGRIVTYRIRFRPARGIFAGGTNPVLLLNEIRALGSSRIVAQSDAIPLLPEINPEECHTYWDILLTTNRGVNAIRDVFIFIEDEAEIGIDVIDEAGLFDEEKDYKKIGEILLERGDITPDELKKALGSHKRIGELLVESGIVAPDKVESALAEQQHVREMRRKQQSAEVGAAGIRVPAARLDSLMNLVGELVTAQSRLTLKASSLIDAELLTIAEEVERLTVELRDNTMSIRMLPIGTTFSKYTRLVRDLSGEMGKQIVLHTEGAETELDKTVIDRLNDPLVHLIRNSIDHGIELPAARVAAGKPRQGTIELKAEHSGASVLIRIVDDGAGLDAEAIRSKAIERGLIGPAAALSEKDLFALILTPGFTTAKKVTNVSGRGVGMDVVKKNIDALRGTIELASQKGRGTTVTLKLPLTLAIIDGLLVQIEGERFVLPLSAVEEVVELSRQDVARAHGQHLASIRGEIVPYIRLREQFRISGEHPDIEQIVTTLVDGCRFGLVVDQVIGEHQTVIKSIGRVYKNVEEVSGATILGDGRVALILDLPKLIRKAEMEEKASKARGNGHIRHAGCAPNANETTNPILQGGSAYE
jgi:two-component system chemotaxis sensor kinase CheA